MMERWREWSHLHALPGGCLFVAAAIELDDQPGPTRDRLVALQKDWLEGLAHAVRVAIDEGHFREDLDPMQFAHDLNAIALGYHWSSRLMRDPRAHERAVNAFEALCGGSRPSPRGGGPGPRHAAAPSRLLSTACMTPPSFADRIGPIKKHDRSITGGTGGRA